eukprot:761396-Hanusia_phi.AAC.1
MALRPWSGWGGGRIMFRARAASRPGPPGGPGDTVAGVGSFAGTECPKFQVSRLAGGSGTVSKLYYKSGAGNYSLLSSTPGPWALRLAPAAGPRPGQASPQGPHSRSSPRPLPWLCVCLPVFSGGSY